MTYALKSGKPIDVNLKLKADNSDIDVATVKATYVAKVTGMGAAQDGIKKKVVDVTTIVIGDTSTQMTTKIMTAVNDAIAAG